MSYQSLEEKLARLSADQRSQVEGYVDSLINTGEKFPLLNISTIDLPKIDKKKKEESPKEESYDFLLFKWKPSRKKKSKESKSKPESEMDKKPIFKLYDLTEFTFKFPSKVEADEPEEEEEAIENYFKNDGEQKEENFIDKLRRDREKFQKMLEEKDYEGLEEYWRNMKKPPNFDL